MNFTMNNRNWKIEEISQEELRNKLLEHKYEVDSRQYKYFGLTFNETQTIYLDKDLNKQAKKATLLHELMHCYIICYLFSLNNLNEEAICDISANSHDIIHAIVSQYFHK